LKEAVYNYLADRSDGADESELVGILFPEGAEANEFSRIFLRRLLAGDPRVELHDDRWRPAIHHLFSIPISEVPFVVVDLEATGDNDFGSSNIGITEVGAVRFQRGVEIDRFERLVNPHARIPPYVEKLTGITNEMVKDAPSIEDVIGPFYEFARGSVLVAHNAAFDYAVLNRAVWSVLRRPLECPSLCTIELVRYAFPELQRSSLEWLAEHFEIERSTRHRAVADAELTGDVLYRCLDVLAGRGVHALGDLAVTEGGPLASARLRVRVPQQCVEKLPAGPGVFRLLDAEGITLFVGRADDVRERVVQLYLNADRLGSRQLEMMTRTCDVAAQPTTSQLEALLEEAAQIRLCDPVFNRGAKHVPKLFFVKLAVDGARSRVMAASRIADDGAVYVGPVRSREFAERAAAALARVFGVALGAPAVGARAYATGTREQEGSLTCVSGAAATELADLLAEGPEALLKEVHARCGEDDVGRRDARVLRRLGKIDQRCDWLVDRHDYIAMLPAAGPVAAVAVVVIGGCFRAMRRLRGPDELTMIGALLADTGFAPLSRRSRAARADAASILVGWLRSRHRDEDGRVFRLRDRGTVAPPDRVLREAAATLGD